MKEQDYTITRKHFAIVSELEDKIKEAFKNLPQGQEYHDFRCQLAYRLCITVAETATVHDYYSTIGVLTTAIDLFKQSQNNYDLQEN